jgi:hypothetical protein
MAPDLALIVLEGDAVGETAPPFQPSRHGGKPLEKSVRHGRTRPLLALKRDVRAAGSYVGTETQPR